MNLQNMNNVRIEFKKQDFWIGAYWDSSNIWICLIPCFPIHISYNSSEDKK